MRVQLSKVVRTCHGASRAPRYHGTPTCIVFACCCTWAQRAPRLGAETSARKRAIKSADTCNDALCNPAVRWADMRCSQNIGPARHSVNSPIIVARNGCKALQGSSPNTALSRPRAHSPAAVVVREERVRPREARVRASQRAASGGRGVEVRDRRPKQRRRSLDQNCLLAKGPQQPLPLACTLTYHRHTLLCTLHRLSAAAAATRTRMPCCTDAANIRVECTMKLSDASPAATNMRRWCALAWLLGSASSACPACLAYTKNCHACKGKAFATTRGLETAISGHYGECLARRQT